MIKIINENSVISPKPRPVRPNICCSNGDSDEIRTKINCITYKNVSIKNIFANRLVFIKFIMEKSLGEKNIAAAKRIISFGIINESEFIHGVIAMETANAEKSSWLKVLSNEFDICIPLNLLVRIQRLI